MLRLLLATNNPGKLHELVPLLGDVPLHIVTPHSLGLHLDVEETGTTYAENARLKAAAFAHGEKMVIETLVAPGVCLRTLRTVPEKCQGRQHPISSRLTADPPTVNAHSKSRQPEPYSSDARH